MLSAKDLEVVAGPFEKKYPGITIEGFEAQGEDSASKMQEESNAGVYTVDVLDTEQNTIYAISQAGLLADYTPPEAADFDESIRKPTFTGFRIQIKPMAYNTGLVSKEEAPKDYDDLLDPKWNGKICAEASEVSVFSLMLEDWGEDAAITVLEGCSTPTGFASSAARRASSSPSSQATARSRRPRMSTASRRFGRRRPHHLGA